MALGGRVRHAQRRTRGQRRDRRQRGIGPFRKTRGQLFGERLGCVAIQIADDRDHRAGGAVAVAIVALDVLALDRGERVRSLAESVGMRRIHELVQAPLGDPVGLCLGFTRVRDGARLLALEGLGREQRRLQHVGESLRGRLPLGLGGEAPQREARAIQVEILLQLRARVGDAAARLGLRIARRARLEHGEREPREAGLLARIVGAARRELDRDVNDRQGMALDEVDLRSRFRDPVIDLHSRLGRRGNCENHQYPESPAAHGQCFTPVTSELAGFKGCGSSTATVKPSSTR